jgi:hypothetical protein
MFWMNVGRSWIATVPGGLSLVIEKDYESQYRVRFGMAEDGHVYSDLDQAKTAAITLAYRTLKQAFESVNNLSNLF